MKNNLFYTLLCALGAIVIALSSSGQLPVGTTRVTIVSDTNGTVISTPLTFTNQLSMTIAATSANQMMRYADSTNSVAGATSSILTVSKTYTDGATNAAVSTAKSYADGCTNGYQNVTNGILAAAKTYTDGATNGYGACTNGILAAAKSYTDGCTNGYNNVTNGILAAAKTYTDGCTNGYETVTNGILSAAKTFASSCTNGYETVTNGILSASKSYTDGCTNGYGNVTNGILSSAKSYTDGATNDAVSVAKSYTDSCTNGYGNVTNGILSSAKSYTDGATNGVIHDYFSSAYGTNLILYGTLTAKSITVETITNSTLFVTNTTLAGSINGGAQNITNINNLSVNLDNAGTYLYGIRGYRGSPSGAVGFSVDGNGGMGNLGLIHELDGIESMAARFGRPDINNNWIAGSGPFGDQSTVYISQWATNYPCLILREHVLATTNLFEIQNYTSNTVWRALKDGSVVMNGTLTCTNIPDGAVATAPINLSQLQGATNGAAYKAVYNNFTAASNSFEGTLLLGTGTTTQAQLQFSTNAELTTVPVPGAMEFDGTNFWLTANVNRRSVLRSAYGGIYQMDSFTTNAIGTGGQYYMTTGWDIGHTNVAMLATSTGILCQARAGGTFMVNANMTYGGTTNKIVKFMVCKNMVHQSNMLCEAKLNASADVTCAGLSGFVGMTNGDFLCVAATSENNGNVVILRHANFTVHRVGIYQ